MKNLCIQKKSGSVFYGKAFSYFSISVTFCKYCKKTIRLYGKRAGACVACLQFKVLFYEAGLLA